MTTLNATDLSPNYKQTIQNAYALLKKNEGAILGIDTEERTQILKDIGSYLKSIQDVVEAAQIIPLLKRLAVEERKQIALPTMYFEAIGDEEFVLIKIHIDKVKLIINSEVIDNAIFAIQYHDSIFEVAGEVSTEKDALDIDISQHADLLKTFENILVITEEKLPEMIFQEKNEFIGLIRESLSFL